MKERGRLYQAIRAATGIIAVATWFGYRYLDIGSVRQPRTPDAAAGLVTPHHVKGITVYISEAEARELSWLLWAAGGFGAVFLALSYEHILKRLRGR